MKKRPGNKGSRRRHTAPRSTSFLDAGRNAPGALRLNKILAAAGLGSRREVEELIVQGRVEIDRELVTDLACKVDPKAVTIKVDGVVLKRERLVYYALNKPPGVLSTNRDPDGRMRVVDLVPDTHRVFSVGRLDRSSEGLMLLTNDGDLAQRLAHPKYGIQKMYFVVVAGIMTKEELDKLHKGVYLAEGIARIDGATIRRQRKGCTELEITLSEGKNREIRRILARAGHKVVLLRRIAIGPLRLGMLPVGASRLLTSAEVKGLYAATEQAAAKPKKRKESPLGKPKRKGPPSESSLEKPVHAQLDEEELLFPAGGFDEDADGDFGNEFTLGDLNLDSLNLADLASSFGGTEEFDEDDDDFIAHFRSSFGGSVLGYDQDESSPQHNKTSRERQPKQATGRRVGGKFGAASSSAGRPPKKAGRAGSAGKRPAKKGAGGGRGKGKRR